MSASRWIRGGPVAGVALWVVLACAPAPPPVEPGTGSLFGDLILVPRQGVVPATAGPKYADPRFADVRLVDYGKPGFAVVYLDAPRSQAGARLAIRSAHLGPRLEPGRAVVGAGGAIAVSNESDVAQIVSSPELGIVRRLAAGETALLTPLVPGVVHLHLLGAESSATVFASPGPFALVGPDARWQLTGLAPGRVTLRAWHARFPPLAREIEVQEGSAQRIDLAVGVDVSGVRP